MQCSGGGGVFRCWLRSSLVIGIRVVSVGKVAHGEPKSRRPPPFYIARCDGGLPVMDELGALDKGVRSRPKWPLGHFGWEINLT
jgi:hypothetical protein